MANNALKFWSTKQFKRKLVNGAFQGGLTIGEVLDQFSKLQGVACDGAINGIRLDADEANPALRLTFETSGGGSALILRDCTGAIVGQFTGTLASASASPSPSASISASSSPSTSPSSSSSASVSPSASPSATFSPSASVSPSSSGSASSSPSVSPSSSSSRSNSPSPSA